MRWCGVRELFGWQIPETTWGFGLRISCIRSSYLTLMAYWVRLLLRMQKICSSNLWSLEFVIQVNLEHDTIAVWDLARSWSIAIPNYFFRIHFYRISPFCSKYFTRDCSYFNYLRRLKQPSPGKKHRNGPPLCYKYWQTHLNTPASSRLHK